MKKIVFIAHDPGGYDVIKPVYEEFREGAFEKILYCVGPSGSIDQLFSVEKEIASLEISNLIEIGELVCLVTGTSWGDSFEAEMLEMCNINEILTISILDYWTNYKSRFKLRDGYVYPKEYLVMDDLAKREAIIDGVPTDIIRVMGHPGLQEYMEKPKVKNTGKFKYDVLLLSQPLSSLYDDSLGFTEVTFLEDCINVLEEMGKTYKIKFHPKEREDVKLRYKELSVNGRLDQLLDDYECVIGMNTMALLHSYIQGKKIISYQPNLNSEDMCITNRLKLTKLIKDKVYLKNALLNINNEKNYSVEKLFLKNAKEKIVNFILEKIDEVRYA